MGGTCPPNFWTGGGIVSFVPHHFMMWKFHGYITVGKVASAQNPGINEKNEHYHFM